MKDKENDFSEEGEMQDNWDIESKEREQHSKNQQPPEKLDKDKSNQEVKNDISEEGSLKDTGYQSIPPAGNNPAKNKDLKAPEK